MFKWYLNTVYNKGYVASAKGFSHLENPYTLPFLRNKWCEGYYAHLWEFEDLPPTDYAKESLNDPN